MASNSTADINKSMTDIVSNPTTVPSKMKVTQALGLELDVIYLQADAYIGNPYALLGSVLEVRKEGNVCPGAEDPGQGKLIFSPSVIRGIKIDENSKIKEPVKRGSIVVNEKLTLGVSFLNYLRAQFEQDTTYSLMVFDQMVGLVDRQDESWDNGLDKWKARNKELLDNPDVCGVLAVIGFVQKYIIRRKFKKFQLGAKGGAFGLNLDGELYTGNEDFSLDILYGLQTVTIKHFSGESGTKGGLGLAPKRNNLEPTLSEINLIHDIALATDFRIANDDI